MDVDDNGRLGHSSPRGGVHWEDQTYSDRSVLLAAPQSFDPAKGGVIIVFFHGNNATLSRDVIARQQIVRQLSDFGLNAVLIAPQLAVDAQDFERRALLVVGRLCLVPQRGAVEAWRPLPRTHAAPSGACQSSSSPIAAAICRPPIRSRSGAIRARARTCAARRALRRARQIRELGGGAGRSAFFVSAYSTSSRAGNDAIRSELEAAGVPTVSGLPSQLTPGVVAFVDAGSVDHNDFVTSAWAAPPCATSSPASAGSAGRSPRSAHSAFERSTSC